MSKSSVQLKSLTKKSHSLIVLSLILILAFLLRFINLAHNPSRMTHDEMSIGYNAFSILKTGRDEWGRNWPLDFKAFGDHKLPGAIYAAVPTIALFGLNPTAVRLPSVIAGTIFVAAVYQLVRILFPQKAKRHLALVAALIAATSPWTVRLSRMMFESNLALALFTLGLNQLLLSVKNHKSEHLFLGSALLGLTFYFYIAYRLISSLFLIGFLGANLINNKNKMSFKRAATTSLIILLTIAPLLPTLLSRGGTARFNQISIFQGSGLTSKISEIHDYCFLSSIPYLAKLGCYKLFSSPAFVAKALVQGYGQFLIPGFVFFHSDQLHYLANQEFGHFFVILAPLLLLGLIRLGRLSQKNQATNFKLTNLLLMLVLITPLPSILSGETQIVRASAFTLPLILVIILGWDLVWQGIQLIFNRGILKKIAMLSLLAIYTGWTSLYLIHDHLVYAHKSAADVYQLPTELVQDLKTKQSSYDLIYINNQFPDAHMAVAFYQQIDPVWYQQRVVRPDPDAFGFSHPSKLGIYQFGTEEIYNFLCQPEPIDFLYVSHNKDYLLPVTVNYTGFSQVHTHAELYDSQFIRQKLTMEQIQQICADRGMPLPN